MKKINIFFAAALLLAASCAKEQIPSTSNEPKLVEKTFVADAAMTKTSLVGGSKVVWTEGDKISVFDNKSNANNPFESSSINGNGACFTGYVAEGATEYVAVYPYRYGTSYDATNKKITTTYPIIQKAVKGSFDNNLNVSVAVSNGETLQFKNIGALLKVTIPEGLTNVRAISLANESTRMSGKFVVALAADGTFTVTGDGNDTNASREVSLDNGGQPMEPGDYYIVVMPGTYKKMFLAVTTMTDELYVKFSTKENVVIASNQVINLGEAPSAGSKDFKLTGIPSGPFSSLDEKNIGFEIGSDYLGKTLTNQNKQKNVISTVTQNYVSGETTGSFSVTFNRPGSGVLDILYDNVRYPILFDVRPWYRDDPSSWTNSTTDATYGAVKTSDKDEKYVEVTPNKDGRADIKRTSKPWVSPTMAPILAARLDDYNDKEGYTCQITFNFADNFKFSNVSFTGAIGGGHTNVLHKYSCSDGSAVIVYDISAQKVGSKQLPEDFLADGNVAIKIAEVKKDGAAVQEPYRFFWFRTFGSLEDLETYLSERSSSTGLTYTKIK